MHLAALIFNVYLFKSSQHLRDNTMLRHIRADIIIEMLVEPLHVRCEGVSVDTVFPQKLLLLIL